MAVKPVLCYLKLHYVYFNLNMEGHGQQIYTKNKEFLFLGSLQ